jgi:hypothetical protein
MSKNLNESLGTVGYDNLFVENIPTADVVTVKLTAAGVVKRGTVISGTPGGADFAALAAAASTSKALYVLADDVDTAEDVVGIAYRTGHFNRGALIVADGYTITAADEEVLRKSGILLADAIEY